MLRGRFARGTLVAALIGCALALASAAPALACSGRPLLQCDEKAAIMPDEINSSNDLVLYAPVVEATPRVAYFRDSSIQAFFRFEVAAAAATGAYDFALTQDYKDGAFESVVPRVSVRIPHIARTRRVSRSLAGALSSLMAAQRDEIVALASMAIALNRAEAARQDRSRPDWLAWQESDAANFALRAASAIGRELRARRTISAAFHRRHYLFGIGVRDVNLARRNVRRHGFGSGVTSLMQSFGLDSTAIAVARQTVQTTQLPPFALNLQARLADRGVRSGEGRLASALRSYANRTPPVASAPGA